MPTALAVERLVINSYPLANPCNRLLDLTGMWKVAYRTQSIAMPYVAGKVNYPSRLDELTVVFPGLLVGEVNSDGGTNANARVGLTANYEEFYAAVLAPVSTGGGTRAVSWVKAGLATTWTGVVQVRDFDVRARDAAAISYSLTLAFSAGRIAP